MAVYKRVLLKLSGEALKRAATCLISIRCIVPPPSSAKWRIWARRLALSSARGISGAAVRARRRTWTPLPLTRWGCSARLSTACAWRTRCVRRAWDAVVMSAVDMNRFCEPFNAMTARRYLSEGRVVLFAAGSGNPFFSTDTAVALRAIEMQVDAILMAKNIDGVYTADPHKDPNATLIKDITYQEALQKGLKVMDAAAFALCAENHVPMVRVFGLDVPENLISVLEGSDMGTFVHP